MDKQKLINLVNDLYESYDRMSGSSQETLDKISNMLGIKEASDDKINAIIWILKKHPEKNRDWAEEQLQRAVDNTDLQEPITAKQYAEILKLEFGV